MASVPLPHQFSVGEAATSTNINTYFSAISFLENVPICQVYQNTPQSAPNGTAAITFDASVIDTYNGHSNSTNNTRYTFQVAGAYLCGGSTAYTGNATGVRAAAIRLNGTTYPPGSQIILPTIPNAGNNTNVPATTVIVNVNVNDYIEMIGTQTSGGNLNTQTGTNNTSTMFAVWLHA